MASAPWWSTAVWPGQPLPEEMTRRHVDLSCLTAIELEIGYDAFP